MAEEEKRWREELFTRTGNYLKNKRMRAKLSLREIAEKVGCKAQFICNIERGKAFPPPQVMRGMIDAYAIEQSELLELLTSLQMKYFRGVYFTAKKRRKALEL